MKVLGSACALILLVAYSRCEYRDISIEQGIVRGHNVDDDTVFSYYGIRYAAAPTGKHIFKAPLPPPKFTNIYNATERNIICPQRPIFSDTFLHLNRSMDCLRMNIFVPNTTETKLPVMLYIHSGSWQEGYGMMFQPIELAKRGVIAVNFNYRLGVHGFLCLGTELAPGNAGMKDQVAALRWLKRNIAQFGGDPDNIALAGSSSGGMSVNFLMISPMADGLFSKIVTESGTGFLNDVVDLEPLDVAETFADQFLDTGKKITELDSFYKEFAEEVITTGYISKSGEIGFTPCIETHNIKGVEKFLHEHPKDSISKGKYKSYPTLAGFTTMEGLEYVLFFNAIKPLMESNFEEFLPSYLDFKSDSEKRRVSSKIKNFYFPNGEITYQGYVDFYTDKIFVIPQLYMARKYAERMPVYLYLYSYNGTVNVPSLLRSAPVWGPGHMAESLLIQEYDFKHIYDNMTPHDFLMQERLRQMWVNFFKYGEPVPVRSDLLDVEWKPMSHDHDNYLKIDLRLQLGEGPLKERVALWDSVYRHYAAAGSCSTHVLSACLLFLCLLYLLYLPRV